MKKVLCVLLVMIMAFAAMQICVSAAEAEAVEPAAVEAQMLGMNETDSFFTDVGTFLGAIVFSPFILIDGIISLFTGVHIFYPWW